MAIKLVLRLSSDVLVRSPAFVVLPTDVPSVVLVFLWVATKMTFQRGSWIHFR